MSEIILKLAGYELRQRVKVRGTELEARVIGILLGEQGVQYNITYWHENIRRVEWVLPEEIAPMSSKA